MTARLDRRAFVLAVASALLARPVAAQTTPARTWRIGLLVPGQPPGCGRDSSLPALIALREGFRERGYVEGQSYVLVVHCAVREGADMRQAAEETARDNVDVVIVASNELARAMQKATTTVPVVFIAVTDPEEDGLVASLARPGGNITGLSHMTGDLAGKRLQLLKDTLPKVRKVAVLATQRHRPTERECVRLGLDAQWFVAPEPGDITGAFAAMKRARPEALLVLPHPMFWLERRRIVAQAAEIGVPAIYESKDFVTAGGLMAYGASLTDMARRAAGYVDRIVKGAKPADLPVEQPTKFELVINLRAARALGLTIPPSVLLRADQVVE
ncbi:MAG TPA: ABC transporter substrate-binding protein [Methylomirabilota bacterium]|nr:ABC transporter substrate-binding protein [Methylomirabilota bacterium]